MKRTVLLAVLAVCSLVVLAQGSSNIMINEVMTVNTKSVQDAFGEHRAWVELVNVSYSTFNVRGMYITTDRSVLDESMSVPERMKRMSAIPSGEDVTNLTARKHLLLYLGSSPANGTLHLTQKADTASVTWVALYDGNAIDLIDSVSVPRLAANTSYAREDDGAGKWVVKTPDTVTPATANQGRVKESKIEMLKRDDPHGLGITVLSMGVVFTCLALLYAFFYFFGLFMSHKQTIKKAGKLQPIKAGVKIAEGVKEGTHKTTVMLKDGLKTGGIDKEVYVAVIAMAMQQYMEDRHDVESGIITIQHHPTMWNHDLSEDI